jgi:soluble lytic murein transglycosylase-like protein
MKPQSPCSNEKHRTRRALSLAALCAAVLLPLASAGLRMGAGDASPSTEFIQLSVADQAPGRAWCALPPREGPLVPYGVDLPGISRMVDRASRASGVEGPLLHAMIMAESSYDPTAMSPAGAVGLMQLMPETARRFGVRDIHDPEQNVYGGARYMKYLLEKFDGDKELAIAAYNSGENAVIRAGNRVPPHPETVAFVPKVIDYYRRFQARNS